MRRLLAAVVALGFMAGGIVLLPSAASGANLITNPSVETPSSGPADPQGWQKNSWGTNSAVFTYDSSGHTGRRSLKAELLSYVDGDAKWYADPVVVAATKSYVYSDYYQSNVPTELFVRFSDTRGATTYQWLGTVPVSTGWGHASVTFTAPRSAQKATVFHSIKDVGYVTIDDAHLSLYIPPPVGTNLVLNASFAMGAPGMALPKGWQSNTWGTNTAKFQYLTASGRLDTRSVKVTLSSYGSGDAKWHFTPIMIEPNKQYVFSDFYTSTIVSKVVAATYDANNAVTYTELAPDVPASTNWQAVSRTFRAPANATKLTIFHLIAAEGSLQIDDVSVSAAPLPTPQAYKPFNKDSP